MNDDSNLAMNFAFAHNVTVIKELIAKLRGSQNSPNLNIATGKISTISAIAKAIR